MRGCYEYSCTKKMDNLAEVDKLLETHNLLREIHEETENINRPTTNKKIESVIKILPTKKNVGLNHFKGNVYQQFKELIPMLLKLFQKIKKEITLPNSLYEVSITQCQNLKKTLQEKKTTGQCL